MKLILIEGIPGSGKTTLADQVKTYYEDRGIKVVKYQEGDLHPVDLAWCAVLSEEMYMEALEKCEDVKENLLKHTKKLDGQYVVGYTNIGLPMKDHRIKTLFEPYEVYGGRVSAQQFMSLHENLWRDFFKAQHEEDVAIFECAYLQNHVNELLLIYEFDEAAIIEYVKGLIPENPSINVEMIYLNNDNVKATIDKVAATRVSPDKSKWDDWIDLVMAYLKCDNLTCVYEYFEKRMAIEKKIIAELDFPVHSFQNPDFDWLKRWERIKEIL